MDLERFRKLAGLESKSVKAPSQLRESAYDTDLEGVSTDPSLDTVDAQEPKDEWPEGFDATYEIAADIEEQVRDKGGYNALPEKLLREIKQLLRSLGEINYRATEAPDGEGTDSEDEEEMGTLRMQARSLMARLKKMKSEKVQESTERLDFSKQKSSTLVALEEAIEDAMTANLTLCEDGAEALLDIEALGLKKVANVTDLGSVVFNVYESAEGNLWFYTSADKRTIIETTLTMGDLQTFNSGEELTESSDRKIEVIKARIEKRKRQIKNNADPEFLDSLKEKLAEAERDLKKALEEQ